ncbi:hypothetical protein GLE_1922 [Lysobacter enzymogenes]|uniref:Uncharacterized protein n=1 Tax=Lysobacter enzymogenes TaxID=69 RepID=A0A0S2DFD3_LYSEN|nr:hypothetical protein GLE_1922 [Lysobacter enzymogenes]
MIGGGARPPAQRAGGRAHDAGRRAARRRGALRTRSADAARGVADERWRSRAAALLRCRQP